MALKHSQNFLRKPELVNELIKKSSLQKDDTVLEIGSGKGIITEALAKSVKSVIAIEADTVLYKDLSAHLKQFDNVKIYNSDFLQYDLPTGRYKIFSNIPFNITAEIIKKIVDAKNAPEYAYLIVQEEAANKYAGQPYGKETLFSVLNKPWFSFSITHKFRRTDFNPVPKVDTALLGIRKLVQPLIQPNQAAQYKDFVTYGFTSVRPNLKKGYKNVFGHIQFLKLADELKFPTDAKPTDLNFEQWVGMFNYFLAGVEFRRQRQVVGSLEKLSGQQKTLDKIHRTRTAKNWQTAK